MGGKSNRKAKAPRLVHVTTVPMTLSFLAGQAGHLLEHGMEVSAISSPGPWLDRFGRIEGVRVFPVRMERRIAPVRDLMALIELIARFRRIRPTIVHAHTPKAGLLGMLAATAAMVPVRIYHLRGFPAATATGWRRGVLETAERVTCSLAHRVICVSGSLRAEVMEKRICAPDRIRVLGPGSGQGVDASGRFDPRSLAPAVRVATRTRYGIPGDAPVIGFVGRLVRDKGIVELVEAYRLLREEFPRLHLLVVGPLESRDPVPEETRRALEEDPGTHLTGEKWDTPPLYAAMDVVVLPSYREGFPNVLLEAAAMERPVVAARVTGSEDAVVDGETGTLVPPRDSGALAAAVGDYLRDGSKRRRHGVRGRRRVLEEFRPERIWSEVHQQYAELLDRRVRKDGLHPQFKSWKGRVKRFADVLLAGVALLLLSPLLMLTALLVFLTLGRPIFFRQRRPGLHGKPFEVVKFRTMNESPSEEGDPSVDHRRLTRWGLLLRRFSIDELPQLWNVLKGEMSLVGPRPLLEEYLPFYTASQARRHEVRPGLTGWAQVRGRNALEWDDRFDLDLWYVDHWSLGLDLRILTLTVGRVLLGQGVSQPGYATVEKFQGSDS